MPNSKEPEQTEQSIFTAWEPAAQSQCVSNLRGMERLTAKMRVGLPLGTRDCYHSDPVTLFQHYLLTEMPRFYPWLAHMGLIMFSENSSQGRVTDTRRKSLFLLCPRLAKNESLLER